MTPAADSQLVKVKMEKNGGWEGGSSAASTSRVQSMAGSRPCKRPLDISHARGLPSLAASMHLLLAPSAPDWRAPSIPRHERANLSSRSQALVGALPLLIRSRPHVSLLHDSDGSCY